MQDSLFLIFYFKSSTLKTSMDRFSGMDIGPRYTESQTCYCYYFIEWVVKIWRVQVLAKIKCVLKYLFEYYLDKSDRYWFLLLEKTSNLKLINVIKQFHGRFIFINTYKYKKPVWPVLEINGEKFASYAGRYFPPHPHVYKNPVFSQLYLCTWQ